MKSPQQKFTKYTDWHWTNCWIWAWSSSHTGVAFADWPPLLVPVKVPPTLLILCNTSKILLNEVNVKLSRHLYTWETKIMWFPSNFEQLGIWMIHIWIERDPPVQGLWRYLVDDADCYGWSIARFTLNTEPALIHGGHNSYRWVPVNPNMDDLNSWIFEVRKKSHSYLRIANQPV